jgi:hypothetical protein
MYVCVCTSSGAKDFVVMMKSGAMQAWPLLQPHLPAAILLAVTFGRKKQKEVTAL